MSGFSLEEVARLAGLTEARVRGLVQAGILEPDPTASSADRFSFRDLVLCRSARRLVESNLSLEHLTDALTEVKAKLPEQQPLSGVGLQAEGRRVLAQDDGVCWEVDSGQVRFEFAAPTERAEVPAIVNLGVGADEQSATSATAVMAAHEWFDLGLELESKHPEQARDAYRRALELDPLDREARLNIARLLRHAGLVEAAEAQYRLAADIHADDERPVYDLGLLLEGQARWWDAVAAYEDAVRRAPRSAEAYRRLAGLYERLGDAQRALGALRTYRSLSGPK